MKNRIKITATLFLFTLFNNTQAEDFLMFSGQAIEIWDGDSFTVRLAESSQQFLEPYLTPPEYRTGIISVQLAGIDCPERSLSNHSGPQDSSVTSTNDIVGHASNGIHPKSASPRFWLVCK